MTTRMSTASTLPSAEPAIPSNEDRRPQRLPRPSRPSRGRPRCRQIRRRGTPFLPRRFLRPLLLDTLAKGFPGPIDAVFGNNDGDAFLLCRVASQHPHVTLHGHFAEIEADHQRFALHHYPDVAHYIAASERFDAVFSGHDHKRYSHHLGRTVWANPGEIMGRFGTISFGIYNTADRSFTHHTVPPPADQQNGQV